MDKMISRQQASIVTITAVRLYLGNSYTNVKFSKAAIMIMLTMLSSSLRIGCISFLSKDMLL